MYDQYRDAQGEPLYPQRAVPITSLFNQSGTMSGKFKGKMIVMSSLTDEIAFPWQADWYRSRVKAALDDAVDNHYRLWFVDKSMHTPPRDMSNGLKPGIATRIINYGPVLHQALRDVAAWVEKDIAPPASTAYTVQDGQVVVPPTAAERKGVQPIATAQVNGSDRAEVTVGAQVQLTAVIETPPGTGSIVGVEWDFEGNGDFPVTATLADTMSEHVEVEASYAFKKAGTYFPAVRASSHRNGDADTPYARIQNLSRVRIVVK